MMGNKAPLDTTLSPALPVKYQDNGDGTFSPTTAVVGSNGVAGPAGSASDPSYVQLIETPRTYLGNLNYTPTVSTSLASGGTIPTGATKAILSFHGGGLYYLLGTGTPSATSGAYAPAGKDIIVQGADLTGLRFIQDGGTVNATALFFS